MDDKYTKKIRQRQQLSQNMVREQRNLTQQAPQIDARLKLDGTRQMQGPLLLNIGHTAPTRSNEATPQGWVTDRLATKSNTGHGHSCSSEDVFGESHSHSISSTTFVKQTRGMRILMLCDRVDLENLLRKRLLPEAIKVIVRNVLHILHLLQDYRDLDAFERERRFEDPEWELWTEDYKRVYGVDEYAEEDRENFLDYGPVRMDPYAGIAINEKDIADDE